MTKKSIIVLIPHYNNVSGLITSIMSINETITIDILIVDDGSKEDTIDKTRIENLYLTGSVFFEMLPQNQGIEHALNAGLKRIEQMSYEYIGRLDCGDLCLKNRFSKQIDYFKNHPDVALLGTWVNVLNNKGEKQYLLKHPTSYKNIKKQMYLNSMFVHPSVVFKTNILKTIGYYPTNYKAAEDYAFFFKIVKAFPAENLPIPLLDYIIDDNSISSTKRKLQVKSRIRVILNNFYFGFYPIYGLLRNCILFFLSRKVTTILKRIKSND